MELMIFLKRLKRYRLVLIFVPISIAIIAYFISLNLPNKYVSHARLASAVADKSQQLINSETQESRIAQEFDNLLQTLTLNKVVDRVSYKLMLHDLQENEPFRKSEKMESLSLIEKNELTQTFTALYNARKSLNTSIPREKELHKLLKSMKYDNESLTKKISASRMENSQYLNLEYSSETPQLSAFVLNTISDEFIAYYTSVSNTNKNRSVAFLDSLLHEKQAALLHQTQNLKEYKISHGILNIDDQAKTIYNRIADIETKKGTAEKDVVAYNVALANIDNRFTPDNHKYFESAASELNAKIVTTKEQIKQTNDAYVQSGFDPKYKARIDSLQSELTHQIYAQTDKSAVSPQATKDKLIAQKLTLEVSRDLAQNSIEILGRELAKLNTDLQGLVPNLANIQDFQTKVEVANKEYLDILQKYNQASLEANYSMPVRIVERAVPGDPAPSKKLVLVALSSIASFMLCIFVLFVMFFFDKTIQSTEQLQHIVDIPVIGSLNNIKGSFLNLNDIWQQKIEGDKNTQMFKNSLRSIRYEIESSIQNGNNVLAVTSFREGEGKTLFTESLAYAFSKMNKKVLVIDGNFINPEISNTINSVNYIEKVLLNEGGGHDMGEKDFITVIGNKGGDRSLLELTNSKDIQDFFWIAKSVYDLIIIETSALESANKVNAKEWISFVDKVVVVFESGRKVDEVTSTHLAYLKKLGSKLAGMVLNKIPSVHPVKNFDTPLLDKPKNEEYSQKQRN